MTENDLDQVNRIETSPSTAKHSVRKKISKKIIQNVNFFSFIRLLILPNQIELKDHSIRVKDSGSEIFSLKQKHEFSKVFSPSASDFIFFSKSLEQFTNNEFFILIIFGSLDIRRLFNYLNYDSYYIFEFEFELLNQLIQNSFDFSNEQTIPISDASSSTYITPKIHYLTNKKNRRNITIYVPEGYFSIIKNLKQMANDNEKLTITLLSQISEIHKDKYSSILSSLSLSTKSLVTPSANANNNISNKSQELIIYKSKDDSINNTIHNITNENQENKYESHRISNNLQSEKNKDISIPEQKIQQTTLEQTPNNEPTIRKSPKKEKDPLNSTQNNLDPIHNKEKKKNKKETKPPTNNKREKQENKDKRKTIQKGSSQSNFLKQIMQNTSSSPNELNGIFDTLGSIIKRSENGWKQTDSELSELQFRLSKMETEQTKEAEALRVAEKDFEQLQLKLVEAKKHRIDLLNEKDKLTSYVTRSISITTKMKKQVREAIDRSSAYEKKVDENTKEMISNIESEASEKILSHEIMTEMAILESDIDFHLSSK